MSGFIKGDFQIAHPLSSGKLWKKLILSSMAFGFLSLCLFLVVILALSSSPSGDVLNPLIGTLIKIVCALFLVVIVIYAIYVQFYIKYYFYDGGSDFITIKKGVFAPTEIHVQYQKIQDVYVDQDILDRVMGLYDVHIASATVNSGIEAHIDGVNAETAERLKNFFLQRIKEKAGGYQSIADQSADTAGGQISATPSSLDLQEIVSADTYPISSRWVFANIITNLLRGLSFALLITFYVSMPQGGVASFVSDFGLSNASLIWIIPLLVLVFAMLHTIYILLWKNSFFFQFLPEYISLRTGIIAKQEMNVPYNTIQNVLVNQGIVDRLFGIATVKIENASGAQFASAGRQGLLFNGVTLPGQPIERAQRIAQILKEGVLSRAEQQGTGL